MTTSEINTTRDHLFRGEFATELVAATRERMNTQPRRKRPRIIAIGRSAHGQPFQVTAPIDFAEAVAEVDARPTTPVWLDHDAIDSEVIGEEFSRTPFLY